jgi:hypothetical protein
MLAMDNVNEIKGKAKGGIARAAALTPEQKREIAKKAAITRWGAKMPIATHRGNFNDEFGINVECYVLNDVKKTAVISQRGMAEALGFSKRGDRLMGFVTSKNMADYIGRELREKIENPIIFQGVKSASTNVISEKFHGYDVTILIDICNAIISARDNGKLKGIRYEGVLENAQIIIMASAKAGIKSLVYALAGYNPTAEEVIAAFKAYIHEEAKKYEQEFPNELYMQWHRLYQIPVPLRGKPWAFKHLTVNHVYFPLAKSNGKILELIRACKAKDGDRQKKLFQFLNEVGARALRIQIGRILEMAESSKNKDEYEIKISNRFGGQQELEFDPI